MKVIPKIQSGGGIPPYTYYTPVNVSPSAPVVQQAASKSSSKGAGEESTKGEFTNKDYLESLAKIDGLPSDTTDIMASVGKYYQFRNLFQDGKVDTSLLASRYINTLNKIKIANFNKEQFDAARTKAINQGGLEEIAITDTGRLVVYNKDGELKQISAQEYLSKPQSYQALTNSNLLHLRAHDSKFSFRNEMLGVVENGIGISTVTKLIQDSINNLGTSEVTKEGYSYRENGRIIKGIELLKEAVAKGAGVEGMSLDGMYKNKLVTKDQYQQISSAIQYIYTTLPTNARTLLEVKSGNAKNPQKGAFDLITKLVTSKSDSTVNLFQDLVTDIDKDGKKVDKSKESELKVNSAGKFLMGAGYKNDYIINPETSHQYLVHSTSMPLTKSNGDYIPGNSSLQEVVSGEYSPILDMQNVSMGMKKVDALNFGKIILSDGNINSIDFPIDVERYTKTGDIIPDLRATTVENKKRAEREITNMGIDLSDQSDISQNISTINKIYQKYKLPPAYNNDGTPTKTWARFGVVNAQASNRALGMNPLEPNPYLQEIDDDAKIDQLIQLTKEENFDKENWYEISALGGEWDDYYKGTLWIPIKASYITALANKDLDSNTVNELIQKDKTLNSRLTKERS